MTTPPGAQGPLYQKLRETLRAQIQSEELAPGSPISTESELIAQYGVSRTTVREAVSGLVREGLLYRRRGKGTYVSQRKFTENLGALTGFTEEMTAQGVNPGARVLSSETVSLHGREAELLDLPEETKGYRIVRVRTAGAAPISLETSILPYDVGVRIASEDLTRMGYYSLLEEHYGIRLSEATQRIDARAASAEEASTLGLRRGAPVLVMERVTSDVSGRRIELSLGVYRADRYSYRVQLRRAAAPPPAPAPDTPTR